MYLSQKLLSTQFLEYDGDGELSELTTEELKALDAAAQGIRLAARIVDTPCNEMNVDYFVQVQTHTFHFPLLSVLGKYIFRKYNQLEHP